MRFPSFQRARQERRAAESEHRQAAMMSRPRFVALFLGATLLCSACARAPRESAKSEIVAPAQATEHALLVHLKLSDGSFGSRDEFDKATDLEAILEEAIARAGVGELDGNEVGGGE